LRIGLSQSFHVKKITTVRKGDRPKLEKLNIWKMNNVVRTNRTPVLHTNSPKYSRKGKFESGLFCPLGLNVYFRREYVLPIDKKVWILKVSIHSDSMPAKNKKKMKENTNEHDI
jgi:hypothetical protein